MQRNLYVAWNANDLVSYQEKRGCTRYRFSSLEGWGFLINSVRTSITSIADLSSRGLRLSSMDKNLKLVTGQRVEIELTYHGETQFKTWALVRWEQFDPEVSELAVYGLIVDDQEESVTRFWGIRGYSDLVPIVHNPSNAS